MSTFYHKETILNEVAAWAEKSEKKADLSRSVFARDVVSMAAHQLSSAIGHVKDFIGLGQGKNSAVQTAPLTVGYLDRYFNKQAELTHFTETCKTFDNALSIETSWPGHELTECFRIAHDGGTVVDYHNEYIVARTNSSTDIANSEQAQVFDDRADLMEYLNQNLPDFV